MVNWILYRGVVGFRGDPYVVRQWVDGFKPLVDSWYTKYYQFRQDAEAFWAQIPNCDKVVDISYAVYADDMQKQLQSVTRIGPRMWFANSL